jgi:hypothetical protein
MNARCCASDPKLAGRIDGAATRPHRPSTFGFASWIVPGAILALMPKCPMCLAAYVAAATGLALSVPVAAFVRVALIAASIACLSYLGVRSFRTALTRTSLMRGR